MTMSNLDKQGEFDRWAVAYDHDIQKDEGFPFAGYREVLRLVLNHVQPGMEVLELGPGTGNLTTQLLSLGAQVWGLDFSAEMLAIALQKAPQAHLAQADLLGEFPEEFARPFDRVVATYVFHEFPPAEKISLLQRLFSRYLRPNGEVIIGDIGFPDKISLERMRIEAGDDWDEEYYWIGEEIQALFPRFGIEVDYSQISSCGAVIIFRRDRPDDQK
jgi:putative AdoMet-dependent methyltransferase